MVNELRREVAAESYPTMGMDTSTGTWQDHINHALAHWSQKNRLYWAFQNYYDGKQPLTFATQKFRGAFGNLFREFADNLCPTVVDSAADRLQVSGYDTGEGTKKIATDESAPEDASPEDSTVADLVQTIYDDNLLDVVIGDVSQESLLAGDAYVIVWPHPNNAMQPTIYPNSSTQICVYYNEEIPRLIDWAAKIWRTVDGHFRVNLYYADRIEKYVTISGGKGGMPTKATGFRPTMTDAVVTHTYGRVPVFHFPNNPGMGQFGRSELAPVVPLQDALNKTIADMMVAMEFVAMPQRYATGIEVTFDEAGKVIPPWDIGIDRILAVASDKATFGQFAQADITQFVKVQNDLRMEMANVSHTPAHYFSKDGGASFPSGESLKTAEAPFVAKIIDRQKRLGPVWVEVMRFALKIAGQPYEDQLDPIWASASPRSERETAELAVLKKTAGVPDEQIWQEMGYTQEQIDEFKAIKEENAKTFGATLLNGLNAGGDSGQQDGPPTNA